MKIQHIIPLSNIKGQSQDDTLYIGKSQKPVFLVTVEEKPDHVVLSTAKGNYTIPFNKILNLFKGEANGNKVHITLKPGAGKLVYWAEQVA